jgi:hypothetical protein
MRIRAIRVWFWVSQMSRNVSGSRWLIIGEGYRTFDKSGWSDR